MAEFLQHEPCPKCGSSDALARYDDGSASCFAMGCKHWEPPTDGGSRPSHRSSQMEMVDTSKFVRGECRALENRGITKETCERWGYQVGENASGEACHIATFRDITGAPVGQKLRMPGKQFKSVNGKHLPLYGMWLWGSKGRSITITEGEIDALTVSQAFGNKWPVVSIPTGVQSAARCLAAHYEYLSGFDKIVLMFDQDEPGRAAVEEAVKVLPPGKVWIATTREKDANATLLKHGIEEVAKAFWNASLYRPDGIISGAEFTRERLKTAVASGFDLPYPQLQRMVLGLRKGELTLLTAGSGIGKSTWARELAYLLHQEHGCSIGNVYLEEGNTKTAQAYVAIHHNVPLGRLRHNTDLLTDAQWDEALEQVIQQRMWFYDHFGSLEAANLINKLHYFAAVCKVDFIILDHISIVTSGVESSGEGERKDIDILMTRLRSLAEATGVGIIAIVHLKRAVGKTFNEGSKVSLSDLRGSGSLEQLSDNVFALERDQQAEDDTKDQSLIRVLKCRETGDTGEADTMIYDRKTGRLQAEPIFGVESL